MLSDLAAKPSTLSAVKFSGPLFSSPGQPAYEVFYMFVLVVKVREGGRSPGKCGSRQ